MKTLTTLIAIAILISLTGCSTAAPKTLTAHHKDKILVRDTRNGKCYKISRHISGPSTYIKPARCTRRDKRSISRLINAPYIKTYTAPKFGGFRELNAGRLHRAPVSMGSRR